MEKSIKIVEEYFDWTNQMESCETLEEISLLEKIKAKNAFAFLKDFFGSNYPREIMHNDTLFRTFFWNKVSWTRVWFTWLADSIKSLKESEGFEEVLKKLKSKTSDDFEEAITLLEYGHKFVKAGFIVEFEFEITNSDGKIKNPDLCLTNPETNEKIFVEVTRLKPDARIEDLSNIFYRVSDYGFMHGKQINCAGRLFKSVSKERLNEIKKEVDKKAQDVLKNDSFEELKKDGVIEMAFATQKNISLLVQWTEEHNYKINSFILPEIDKFKRLKNKIIHKSTQSSPTCSNLLIIKNDDFLTSTANPAKTFDEIEETLYQCEDLLGTIIVSYQFGEQDKKIESFGMNTFITKTERHALTSLTGIMINKFYKKIPVTMHTLTRIIEAFERN